MVIREHSSKVDWVVIGKSEKGKVVLELVSSNWNLGTL